MKIIVTGSLGHIGQPLTQELVQRGHSVIVISSNPEKQKDIEALGATAAIGSIEDADFLAAVFKGADVVHAMIPPNSMTDPIAYSRKVGDSYALAIRQAGVTRVVYVSSYGAELEKGAGLIALHRYVEDILNGLPDVEAVTLLRATYIYYNMYRLIGMIKSTGFIAANYGGEDRVVMVSPKDIALAAADEIENQVAGRHVRYVASDERTCNEIAGILGRAIDKPDLKWITISNEEVQKGYEAAGIPPRLAEMYVEMFGAIHTDLLHRDYDLHKPELGKLKSKIFQKNLQ